MSVGEIEGVVIQTISDTIFAGLHAQTVLEDKIAEYLTDDAYESLGFDHYDNSITFAGAKANLLIPPNLITFLHACKFERIFVIHSPTEESHYEISDINNTRASRRIRNPDETFSFVPILVTR